MPKIPLYERSVLPTTQIGGAEARYDSRANDAIVGLGKTVSDIGQKVTKVGLEYESRKQALKEKADISDYKVRARNFETELAEKKNDALMNGMSYQDVMEKVVKPETERFNSEIGGLGYSEKSEGAIRQQWAFDSAGIVQKEVAEREQMELQDYVSRIDMDARSLLQDGTPEGIEEAESLYKDLEGTVGEAKAYNLRSKGYRDLYQTRLRGKESAYWEGLYANDQEYIDDIRGLKDEFDNLDVNPAYKEEIEVIVDAREINFKRTRAKEVKKGLADLNKNILNGKFEDNWYQSLEASLGSDFAQEAKSIISGALRQTGVADSSAAPTIQKLLDYYNGNPEELSLYQVVGAAGNLDDQAGALAISYISIMTDEAIAGNRDIDVYNQNFWGKKFDTDINFSDTQSYDYLDTLMKYVVLSDDGQGGLFKDKVLAYNNWKENPDGKTYEEFKRDTFLQDATAIPTKINAPQQQNTFTTFDEAEAANLPSGTEVIIGGKKYKVD